MIDKRTCEELLEQIDLLVIYLMLRFNITPLLFVRLDTY